MAPLKGQKSTLGNHTSSDIFNHEHQIHTFSIDDINSQWRDANVGRMVNQKICKFFSYANFVTITMGKAWGFKIDFPQSQKLKILKVNIGTMLAT